MSNNIQMLNWTFIKEVEIPENIDAILIENEKAIACFKTVRDCAIFTNKRIIFRDAQGLTGKKIEIYSLPYKNILMWSSENAHGIFDINSELELWTKIGKIKINLNKNIDIRKFDSLIAKVVL